MVRTLAMFGVWSLLLVPLFVYAQFSVPQFQAPITVRITPEYPNPGEEILIEIESFATDLNRTVVEWYENSELVRAGEGESSHTLTAGPLGSGTIVSIVVRDGGEGGPGTLQELVIRPALVDIVWEADTYTHPFFKGRALAGPGSMIRAEGFAYLYNNTGERIPQEALIYTWLKNGRALEKESGRGKNTLTTESPLLFGEDTLTLEVSSSDDQFKSSSSVVIPSTETHIALYEVDVLLGLLHNSAIQASQEFNNSELTLAAIPYFTNISSPADTNFSYSWKINNSRIESDPFSPFLVTLRLSGVSTLVASVVLEVAHQELFLQALENTWNLTLGGSEDTLENDPFSRFPNSDTR